MALFDNRQESNLRSAVQMIEEVISSLGHALPASRIERPVSTSGARIMAAWRLRKGAAFVYVVLSVRGAETMLQMHAPLLHLGPGIDEARLFRRLLELNGDQVAGAAFALKGTDVVLVAERPTIDLDRVEVRDLVQRVESYAVAYEPMLVAEFGGRAAGVSAAPVVGT